MERQGFTRRGPYHVCCFCLELPIWNAYFSLVLSLDVSTFLFSCYVPLQIYHDDTKHIWKGPSLCLTFYHIETPINAFANIADPDQTAIVRAA